MSSTQLISVDSALDIKALSSPLAELERNALSAEAEACAEQQRKRSAWAIFLADRRAQLALPVIVLLLLAAGFGPLLWPQDPAQQWLSQTRQGPSLSTQAMVVDREALSASMAGFDSETAVLLHASTEAVVYCLPQAVSGAQLYRFESTADELFSAAAMPLGERNGRCIEDALALQSKHYRYELKGSDGAVLAAYSANPVLAVSLFEAQLQGLEQKIFDDGQPYVSLPAHPLGTDALGRDLLARLLQGAQSSLLVGLLAPLLFIAFGAVYGALSGLAGGWLDAWMMRFVDFVIALPFLLFMILFRVVLGTDAAEAGSANSELTVLSGLLPLILALVLLSWPASARLVRGQVLQLREQPYVQAAVLAGASRSWIIRVHLLPNVAPLLLVSLSFAIPQAIFTEAILSFIGLGVVPPTASWGSLCHDGMKDLLNHPWGLLFPALAISAAVLAFNQLGEALRDAFAASSAAGD